MQHPELRNIFVQVNYLPIVDTLHSYTVLAKKAKLKAIYLSDVSAANHPLMLSSLYINEGILCGLLKLLECTQIK